MDSIRKYELSDLDRLAVSMMVKAFIFYELRPDTDLGRLTASVMEGVKHATSLFPFMAGNIQFDELGKPCIVTARGKHMQFSLNQPHHPGHKPFSSLTKDSFPPNDIDPSKLLPDISLAERPICIMQLNIIEGGLILAFAMNHTAGDWASMDAFLTLVCQGSKAYQENQEMPKYTPDLNKAPYNGVPGIPRDSLLAKLPSYYVMEKSQFTPKLPPPFQTGIYRISEASIQQLKAQCAPHLDRVDYITSYDCISALLWTSITRSRLRLHPEKSLSSSRFLHPINLRSRDPENKTSERYFGNGVFPTQAGPIIAQDLIAGEYRGLATAASMIRRSVNSVNMTTIHDLTSLVTTLSPTEVLGVHADFHDMDVLMNSWNSGRAAKYDIGGGSVPVAFRPHRPITGACCLILPNFGKEKTFEVFIQLAKEEHECVARTRVAAHSA
ncbi:transferase [Aspergillus ambiguus]|uniref:transferase n=1 Tax=Aspergillus ambiguus TaxID=176160 RepID=UPI003CCE2182